MKYKIIDNFLEKENFKHIQNIVTSSDFPWYFQKLINDKHSLKDNTCYFTHTVFNQKYNSIFFENCFIFTEKLKVKSYLKIKLNCFPSSKELKTYEAHKDFEFKHKAAVFYINTNDGFTILEKKIKIESIENRLLIFEGYKKHSSTNCTNAKARFNINFNYF